MTDTDVIGVLCNWIAGECAYCPLNSGSRCQFGPDWGECEDHIKAWAQECAKANELG